jgi:hypothetical protein
MLLGWHWLRCAAQGLKLSPHTKTLKFPINTDAGVAFGFQARPDGFHS